MGSITCLADSGAATFDNATKGEMETLFLPINTLTNRVLNADETTVKRRLDFIQGEQYEVYLKFLSGGSVLEPEIDAFSFILRTKTPNSYDLLTGDPLASGSGLYPYKFSFAAGSPPLNSLLSGRDYADVDAQITWTQGTGDLEIIQPLTARITAATAEFTGNLPYVSFLNGLHGALTLAGAGTVTVSQADSLLTISGDEPDLSAYATKAALAATGASAQTQIANLASHTGDYYQRSNPSGFITGVDLSPYATVANLEATGANLWNQIEILRAATGDYYAASNPAGYITSAALAPYATAANLAATGANLQSQVAALNAATEDFYPRSNPSGFITGVDLSSYATNAALAATGAGLQSQISALAAATGSYATAANLSATGAALSASISSLTSLTGDYYPRSNPSGYATTSFVQIRDADLQGAIDDLAGDLANYYLASNPAGYINSAALTSASGTLQGQISTLNAATGSYLKAIPADVVRATGDQEISGEKTFRNRVLAYDNGNVLSIDTHNRELAAGAIGVLNWGGQSASDYFGSMSYNWSNRETYDATNVASLNWSSRFLMRQDGSPSVNWQDSFLNGNWQTDTFPTESGSLVNKGYFDAQTGNLASVFYGLGNPFGFITISSLTPYATTAALNATGSALSGQIATLRAATGSYVNLTGTQSISGDKTFFGKVFVRGTGSLYPLAALSTQQFFAADGSEFNWNQLIFRDANELLTADMKGRVLYDDSEVEAVSWGQRVASDSGALDSLNWNNRTLINTGGGATVNWESRTLHGTWTTDNAPTQSGHLATKGYVDSVTGSLGGGGSSMGYTLQFTHGTMNPADASNQYFGAIGDLGSTVTQANAPRVYIPKAGTIKAFYGGVLVGSTLGSSETANVFLVKNGSIVPGGTGVLAYSDSNRWNTMSAVTGLNTTVAAGDYLYILVSCPTWATNPTAVRHSITAYIE